MVALFRWRESARRQWTCERRREALFPSQLTMAAENLNFLREWIGPNKNRVHANDPRASRHFITKGPCCVRHMGRVVSAIGNGLGQDGGEARPRRIGMVAINLLAGVVPGWD